MGTSCGTIVSASVNVLTSNSLSHYIIDRRHGKAGEAEDETKLMLNLVEENCTFEDIITKTDLKGELDGLESTQHVGQVVASATYSCLLRTDI